MATRNKLKGAVIENGPRVKVGAQITVHVARMQSLSSLCFIRFLFYFIFNLLETIWSCFLLFSRIIINYTLSLSLHSLPFSVQMALAHCLAAVPLETSKHSRTSILTSSNEPMSSLSFTSSSPLSKPRSLSIFPRIHRIGHKGKFFTISLILIFIIVLGLVLLRI